MLLGYDEDTEVLCQNLAQEYQRLVVNTERVPGKTIENRERHMLYMNDFRLGVDYLVNRGLNAKSGKLCKKVGIDKQKLLHLTRLGLQERFQLNLSYIKTFTRDSQPDIVTGTVVNFLLEENGDLLSNMIQIQKTDPAKASLAEIVELYPRPFSYSY